MKTVIGSSSQMHAAPLPAIRQTAQAANAEATWARIAVPTTIGRPTACSSRISLGSPAFILAAG